MTDLQTGARGGADEAILNARREERLEQEVLLLKSQHE